MQERLYKMPKKDSKIVNVCKNVLLKRKVLPFIIEKKDEEGSLL